MSYYNQMEGSLMKAADQLGAMSLSLPTLKERLESQIIGLNNRKSQLEELKILLEKNPEIERVMTLISTAGV